MLHRLWHRFTYWMERSFVRGAQYRLLLIAALIGLISMAGGVLVVALGTGFDNLAEAVWWAFLRLTDPGYLGDDAGVVNRTISTILTVLGYVVFLGALVAVMTQWLHARMIRLEQGLTPVARDGHVLVLGWTNRTESIVRELLLSKQRVKRFLRRHGTGSLHIVIMAENVSASLVQDLRDAVGESWDEQDVTLRSGSPLRVEHLARVDHRNAAAVIVPGAEFRGGEIRRADSHTLKTLLSLKSDPEARGAPGREAELPLVVAEIFDGRQVGIAKKAYPGPLEIVSSDAVVSRLLAQNIRHPRLSHVYNELLTHEGGCEIYVREHPELDGTPFDALRGAFGQSILMGVVRQDGSRFVPHLNPSPGFRVEATDRFVHLAGSYASTVQTAAPSDAAEARGPTGTRDASVEGRRIMLLGWNHKVPAFMRELASYGADRFEIDVVSRVAISRRERALERSDLTGALPRIEHHEGDYTDVDVLRRARPAGYDTVLLVGSDRTESETESDARTIVGSLLLDDLELPNAETQTIVELLDPDNVRLLGTERGEVIISPMIVSHMLAHVALRPELGTVFDELFTAGGAEITFQPLRAYHTGDPSVADPTFAEVRSVASARGEIALGLQLGPRSADLHLNPPPDMRCPASADAQVVTMVTFV